MREIAERAHRVGALVLVDGAQAAPHLTIDVQALGADFYAFSGHKVYGPSGIGVLWGPAGAARRDAAVAGRRRHGAHRQLREDDLRAAPHRFEAGTPAIEAAIGLSAALDYLTALGSPARGGLGGGAAGPCHRASGGGARVAGDPARRGTRPPCCRSRWRGSILTTWARSSTRRGVAVRAGHHCAQPVMQHFGVPATSRASFGLYNSRDEVEALAAALHRARQLFG